jgi:holo-[acyl-carrier protein] synthase
MANIYGIGTDIVNISRIKAMLKKNKNFKNRIFSSMEIKHCEAKSNKIASYAKRFAAKEAFSKALGTGISNGINFNEIIVSNIKSGKPNIKLLGKTKKKVNKVIKKNKFNIFLSLSDDKPFALATVVISL